MNSAQTNGSCSLIAIVGETASGKTSAAIEIAKRVNGEIICADSRTVYKQLDIATAKPTKTEREAAEHHLVDVVYPNEKFSAAQFKRLAEKCIQDIQIRGKVPIVVGGTGLYIDALLYNFQFADKPDEQLRQNLEQMNDDELTTLLKTKNIDTSSLNTKNRRHVIRAIERNGVKPNDKKLRTNTIILGISLERSELRARVTRRTELMFDSGLLEEAKSLIKQYGSVESLKTPGYQAAERYLANEITLDEAKSQFIQADMQLAKRQRTWFRRSAVIEWFDDPKLLVNEAVRFIDNRS